MNVHGSVLTLGGIDNMHCDKGIVYEEVTTPLSWSFIVCYFISKREVITPLRFVTHHMDFQVTSISIKQFSIDKIIRAESDTTDPIIICPVEVADLVAKEAGAEVCI